MGAVGVENEFSDRLWPVPSLGQAEIKMFLYFPNLYILDNAL